MGLTVLEIERAKARGKLYRLFDGNGLFIEITPPGTKRWRVKYYLNGRERRLSLGLYPKVSLAQARERLKGVRDQVDEGTDPALARAAAENLAALDPDQTFEGVQQQLLKEYHSPSLVRLDANVLEESSRIDAGHRLARPSGRYMRSDKSYQTPNAGAVTGFRRHGAFARVLNSNSALPRRKKFTDSPRKTSVFFTTDGRLYKGQR